MQEEPNNKKGEEKTEAHVAQQGNTNRKSTKKKNVKKRSFEVEADRWEEMKREGKVDNCRLWLLKIRFGQARERKQLQWRESFNVFSGVGFRCGSKREKRTWSQWCHTRLARSSSPINFRI